jgi:hypothetical protein
MFSLLSSVAEAAAAVAGLGCNIPPPTDVSANRQPCNPRTCRLVVDDDESVTETDGESFVVDNRSTDTSFLGGTVLRGLTKAAASANPIATKRIQIPFVTNAIILNVINAPMR